MNRKERRVPKDGSWSNPLRGDRHTQSSAPNIKVLKATLLCEKVEVCAWMNSKYRCLKYNKGWIRGRTGPVLPGQFLSSLSKSPGKSQCTEKSEQSSTARQARGSLVLGLPPPGVSHCKSEREQLIKAPLEAGKQSATRVRSRN